MVHGLWNQWPKYLLINSIKNSVKEETINNWNKETQSLNKTELENRGKVSALSLSLTADICVSEPRPHDCPL